MLPELIQDGGAFIIIDGNSVCITLDSDGGIAFLINGSFEISNVCSKITIVKWLLNQFEIAKEHNNYLYVGAYSDNSKEYREKVYRKLGFKHSLNNEKMEWFK